jgi:hypothetical protein
MQLGEYIVLGVWLLAVVMSALSRGRRRRSWSMVSDAADTASSYDDSAHHGHHHGHHSHDHGHSVFDHIDVGGGHHHH